LIKIKVLNHPQRELRRKLDLLKQLKENNPHSMSFLQLQYNGKMKEVEDKIQYKFKNKIWLLEALTHKSFMDTSKLSHFDPNQTVNTIFPQ
jgi:hypothetical protein